MILVQFFVYFLWFVLAICRQNFRREYFLILFPMYWLLSYCISSVLRQILQTLVDYENITFNESMNLITIRIKYHCGTVELLTSSLLVHMLWAATSLLQYKKSKASMLKCLYFFLVSSVAILFPSLSVTEWRYSGWQHLIEQLSTSIQSS